MTFQSRVPTNADRELSAGQAASLRKAEAGHRLSEFDLGHLRSVEMYAKPSDAKRAAEALAADRERRRGRRKS